jgi:hypothetical protein
MAVGRTRCSEGYGVWEEHGFSHCGKLQMRVLTAGTNVEERPFEGPPFHSSTRIVSASPSGTDRSVHPPRAKAEKKRRSGLAGRLRLSWRAVLLHDNLETSSSGRSARRSSHADRITALGCSRVRGAATAAATAGSQPQRGASENHDQSQQAHAT